jgi:hypothetical protein
MPAAFNDVLPRPKPPEPPRKVWTRAECAVLASVGLLEGGRFELVGGELIDKMGKKRPHVNALTLLMAWLVEVWKPVRES